MIDDFFVGLLIAAYLMLFFVLLYLAGRKMWELLTRRHSEPETYGDQGGFPSAYEPAPENGSGERAGDGRKPRITPKA